jgi:predicted ABC-type ATPase/uncharacterized membrane protein YgcG
MLEDGYRLYDAPDGRLCFDQVVGGRIIPLRPDAGDARLPRGWYTPDFRWMGPVRVTDWEESKHHRGQPGNKGQFGPGGGGGGGGKGYGSSYVRPEGEDDPKPKPQPSYVRASENDPQTPRQQPGAGAKAQRAAARLARRGAAKAVHAAVEFGDEDYRVIHEQVKAISEDHRNKMVAALSSVGHGLAALIKAHGKEEKANFVGAAGALHALVTGGKPSEEQWTGLKAVGRTVILAAVVMASGGHVEAAGAAEAAVHVAGHAATGMLGTQALMAGGHLAAEFGQELVQHIILEHAARLMAGSVRAVSRKITGKDAEPPPRGPDGGGDELSGPEMALLQQYVGAIGQTIKGLSALSEDQVRELLMNAPTDDDPEAEATRDVGWRDWEESKHHRGQPNNSGQFGPGGGGGGGGSEGGGKSDAPRGASEGGGGSGKAAGQPAKGGAEAAGGAKGGGGEAGGKEAQAQPGSGGAHQPGPAESLFKGVPPHRYTKEEARATADSIAAKLGVSKEVDEARAKLDARPRRMQTIDPVEDGGYKMPDGSWTPERAALHRQILDKLFTQEAIDKAIPKPGEKPVVTFLGGRGGSGKSSLTDGPGAPCDAAHAIVVDADKFKEQLKPEYAGWNADQVHEESDQMVRMAEDTAIELGLNIVHDATMKSTQSILDRAGRYEKAGYAIEGHYMHAPAEVAMSRAMMRFAKKQRATGDGRFVPPEVILGNVDNEKNFDTLIPKFRHWSVFDNSGTSAQFVAGDQQYGAGAKKTGDRGIKRAAKAARRITHVFLHLA